MEPCFNYEDTIVVIVVHDILQFSEFVYDAAIIKTFESTVFTANERNLVQVYNPEVFCRWQIEQETRVSLRAGAARKSTSV